MRPSPSSPRPSKTGPWIRGYRVALRLYPRAYRERFGTEMEQVFREQWRRVQGLHSPMSTLTFGVRTVVDVLISSGHERLTALKSALAMKKPLPPGMRVAWSLGAGVPVALLVTAATIVITLAIPSTFQSTTRILIRQQGVTMDPFVMQTEAERILSPENLARASEALSLGSYYARQFAVQGGPLKPTEVAPILRDRVSVQGFRNTTILEIRVHEQDRQLAADIANALAEGYLAARRDPPPLRTGEAETPVAPALIDRAQPGLKPVRPNLYLNTFIGALIGTALGLITALIAWVLLRRAAKSVPPLVPPNPSAA